MKENRMFAWRNMMNSARCKLLLFKAFTLIELLMVIAIISILSAILLPTLNKAKEKGRAIKCTSNFKQIGNALMLYSVDYNEYIPPYLSVDGGTGIWGEGDGGGSAGFLKPYLTSMKSGYVIGGYNAKNGVSNIDRMMCPSVDINVDPPQNAYFNSNQCFYSMGYNEFLHNYYIIACNRPQVIRLTSYKYPSFFSVVTESIGDAQAVLSNPMNLANTSIDKISFRHSKRANILHADFHVSNYSYLFVTQNFQKGNRYWNPIQ
jgi:prepilin-type N-terminal cleavage/methylation domain-containing protein/prepilin-type processing-associated H-X9-DG protein